MASPVLIRSSLRGLGGLVTALWLVAGWGCQAKVSPSSRQPQPDDTGATDPSNVVPGPPRVDSGGHGLDAAASAEPDVPPIASATIDAATATADAISPDALPELVDPTTLRTHVTDYVFDDTMVRTWNVTMDPADLTKLNDTAFQKIYVPATLKVDGEDVGPITIRYKGQYSLNVFCNSNGKLSCSKVSYKIDFSGSDTTKRFHGLKHIFLHSHNEDATRLHERLAYQLFREAGVPAPRSVHAKVFVNGVYKGVFGLTEVIDGKFTDYWFPKDNNGNLYKEAWPASLDEKFYADRQKTNEGQIPPTTIVEAATALKAAAPVALPALVDSWFGLDYLVRVVVVDRAISDWDDFLSFYADGPTSAASNHNFFIYESPSSKHLTLLPWDMDKAFPVTAPQDQLGIWNDPHPKCDSNTFADVFWLKPPACDPVISGLAAGMQDRYTSFIDRFVAGPYDLARMRGDLDRWAGQIQDAVMTESGTVGLNNFHGAVDGFKNDLATLREKLLLLRNNQPPVPFYLKLDAVNDLEKLTPFSLLTGLTTGVSARSTIDRKVNQQMPLAGQSDIKFTFELRNTVDAAAGAWAQRAYVRLAFKPYTVDLTKLSQVQIKVRADSKRPVRIEFGSTKYKVTDRPLRFGWDFMADTTPSTVNLDVAHLAQPTNAPPPGDLLKDILANATILYVVAVPKTLGPDGLTPAGTSDAGWVQFDDVQVLQTK